MNTRILEDGEKGMQPASFDYAQLDATTAAFVGARTGEIRALVRRSAQDIIEIGAKLIEVKERLPHGAFGQWLESEFGWSWDTAGNFMRVAGKFRNFRNIDGFAPSALYLLAAPSTPETAVEEAVTAAANGTAVSYSQAREIVARHKEPEAALRPIETEAPKGDAEPVSSRFACPECGEIFGREVWHCPYCDHHWDAGRRDCANCHHPRPTPTEARAINELREAAPDLFEDVVSGKKNIPWARRVLAERQSMERAQQRAEEPTAEMPTNVRLMVGDALNIDLPDESVDVIITSPPYNLGDEEWPMGGHGREAREGIGYEDALGDEPYQEWQLHVLDELYRVAKPGASLFYNHKARTRGGVLYHPLTWLQHVRGWTLRQEIIWDREVTHNHSATLFWPVDERIYWFTKGPPALAESVGMSTVWRFHGPQPYTWHPAPFPEELPRRCLQAIGGRGLTVLDPFAGSCTTIKVAAGMGHESIGVDISADYIARARAEHGW